MRETAAARDRLKERCQTADLAIAVSCPRRDLCELRPESLTSRDPAWLGPGARRLVLGFLDVEAEQVLTSILAVFDFPHCFAARDRVEDWARRIEESWPEDRKSVV